MGQADVVEVLNDPLAQRLMAAAIPARLAYVAVDGTPRVVPMGFHWNGAEIVMATVPVSPKVSALRANPVVALTVDTNDQPPNVLMVRGTVRVHEVDGVPEEFLAGSRKLVRASQWDGFEAGVRALYARMSVITVTPTWAKVLDFETRIPDAVARLAAAHAG